MRSICILCVSSGTSASRREALQGAGCALSPSPELPSLRPPLRHEARHPSSARRCFPYFLAWIYLCGLELAANSSSFISLRRSGWRGCGSADRVRAEGARRPVGQRGLVVPRGCSQRGCPGPRFAASPEHVSAALQGTSTVACPGFQPGQKLRFPQRAAGLRQGRSHCACTASTAETFGKSLLPPELRWEDSTSGIGVSYPS